MAQNDTATLTLGLLAVAAIGLAAMAGKKAHADGGDGDGEADDPPERAGGGGGGGAPPRQEWPPPKVDFPIPPWPAPLTLLGYPPDQGSLEDRVSQFQADYNGVSAEAGQNGMGGIGSLGGLTVDGDPGELTIDAARVALYLNALVAQHGGWQGLVAHS